MNHALNAPIRKRAGDTLQLIQIPFTGQGNLGLLQYLDSDIQNKVGVTKAAQGLDPDALQSTDKDAVLNTIATSQGQAELMVRNIVETGLIRLFRLVMRLAVRHMDPMQLMKTKGKVIPISLKNFDPDAAAVPNVGLGTATPQQQMMALNFVYGQQKEYMQQFGPNNPFTSMAQMYNTLEDLLEAQNLYNVERYFNIVTPEVEAEWARQQERRMEAMRREQQENAPMDPGKALFMAEQIKAQVKQGEMVANATIKQEELRLKAIEIETKDDRERDELVQNRVIELAKIKANNLNDDIEKEQDTNDSRQSISSKSGGSSSTSTRQS